MWGWGRSSVVQEALGLVPQHSCDPTIPVEAKKKKKKNHTFKVMSSIKHQVWSQSAIHEILSVKDSRAQNGTAETDAQLRKGLLPKREGLTSAPASTWQRR